jgi:hypothetical protein
MHVSSQDRRPVEEAVRAALAAWDRAMVSPSRWGFPSVAAVAAYSALRAEPEEDIRARLVAALIARAQRLGRALH